ncbi:MAG TPA: hypothetical protein VGM27_23845 [Acidobacteriaceae bacterium]
MPLIITDGIPRIELTPRTPAIATLCLLLLFFCTGCGRSPSAGTAQDSPFSVSVDPGSISLTSGGAAQTIQISASAPSGDKGPVSINISGLPAGVTATPSTLSLSPGIQQSITLAAAHNTGVGSTQATLFAALGSQIASAPVKITIAPQSTQASAFKVSVDPGSISLTSGGAAQTIQISASVPGGNKGPVSIKISGLPAGVSASPSTLSLSPGIQQSITLAAAQNTGVGNTQAMLLAALGNQSLSAPVSITIAPQIPVSTSDPASVAPLDVLTGCTNPYTGTSNGDWGTGGETPVYLDPGRVGLGTPAYTTNTIFWTSRETGPGQSVLLTGAFTPAAKTVRVALIPPGTSNWQAAVASSGTTVMATQQGTPQGGLAPPAETTWLSFTIPSNFASGIYGFEIIDPTAPPLFGLANVPAMNWVVGIPSQPDPAMALQHQVHDCGAEPGETLRIFGKNFVPSNQVMLQSPTGHSYPLAISKIDSNSIAAAVPSTLPVGSYSLLVGNSPWDASSSAKSQLTIYAAPSYKITSVNCPLIGGGTTDNLTSLQACLDENAPTSGTITYISLPAGIFAVSGTITPHAYQVLLGESAAATKIVGSPVLILPQYSGLADLSITGPARNLIAAANVWNSAPADEGHIYLNGVSIQNTIDSSSDQLGELAGPDIQIYNSSFLTNSNQLFNLDLLDGAVIAGNVFGLMNMVVDSQNVIFENNTTASTNTLVINAPSNTNGGVSISRGFSRFGKSALSQDIYIGYNKFQNVGISGQQVMTTDGGGGSYFGSVASSTDKEVILANAPSWEWMGTTNPGAAVFVIVAGTGVGQYSFLSGWSGTTIDLATPLQVLPDSTSVVAITQFEYNITVANNTFTNTLGGQIILGSAPIQGLIENNTLVNSAGGILIAAQPYGGYAAFNSVLDVDVLNNKLSAGDGNLIATDYMGAGGIGIADFPGCLTSGVLMRGNTVPSQQTMYLTNGWNQVNGVLSELNTGNWSFTFPLQGLLIQNNTAP